jgi:predicted TPR repeat methyltransferase
LKTASQAGKSVDELVSQAVALHRAGQRAQAGKIYRKVLKSHPDHPDALHFSGLLAHQLGDEKTALASIRRAIEVRPDYADAIKNLGNILLGEEQHAEAERCYRRVIELDPQDSTAYSNLGVACRYQYKFEQAIEAGTIATRMTPDQLVAWYNLGNTHKIAHNFKQAIACYQQAIRLNPMFSPAHDGLCRCTLALEQGARFGRRTLRKTIDAYQHWLECEPDSAIALFMLGAVKGENRLDRAPDDVVRKMFDQFAPNFEHRLGQLEYRVPRLIEDVLRRRLEPAGRLAVLDGGCGTGLCAPALRPYAAQLTGVDLSSGMLALARKTGLYDELVEAELTSYLSANKQAFDLVIFADTLCYFGNLADVISATAGALRAGGTVLFTVERAAGSSETLPYRLHPHGRYSHTETYVRSVLTAAGFSANETEDQTLRQEIGRDVAGLVVTAVHRTAH